jgi:hypothetical protein
MGVPRRSSLAGELERYVPQVGDESGSRMSDPDATIGSNTKRERIGMGDTCELRKANGVHDGHCDGEACVYWRAVGHLGVTEQSGCALQHYELLGDRDMTLWLMSVKERVNNAAAVTSPAESARL